MSRLESSVDKIIDGLSNLTKIVQSQNSIPSPMNISSASGVTKPNVDVAEPNNITQPTNEVMKEGKNKGGPPEEGLRKWLFAHTITGKNSTLYADMEPLHNVHFDGMKQTVEIPKVIK